MSRIGQFYFNNYIGCNVEVCGVVNGPETMEAGFNNRPAYRKDDLYYSQTTSSQIIAIGMSKYGSLFTPYLDNKYNFINILYHENDHIEKHGFDGLRLYYYIENIKEGDKAISRHLSTYFLQKNHWSFQKTTPSFKDYYNSSVKDYIKGIENPELKDRMNGLFKN